MKSRLIWALSLVLCGTSLEGQTRLHFIDSVTGDPIPYVNITYGENEGKYTNEDGVVIIPEGVRTINTSHITYEPLSLDLESIGGSPVTLKPVVTELRPAIIVPKNVKKKTIGYASIKGESSVGGRNGYCIAEYFGFSPDWSNAPIISAVDLNLNTLNLKRDIKTRIGDTEYTDGIMYVAKLRIDLRIVDPVTGGPGGSLIGGGVIYLLKDRFNLNLHKLCKVSLPNPEVFPEEGLFVVVEWIVTDDVRVQDMVSPSIWTVPAEDGSSSWVKWPLGTAWRRNIKGAYDSYEKAFCIGLDLMQ
jgi:hypothetical protein